MKNIFFILLVIVMVITSNITTSCTNDDYYDELMLDKAYAAHLDSLRYHLIDKAKHDSVCYFNYGHYK